MSKLFEAKVIDDEGAHLLLISADSLEEAEVAAAGQGKVVYCKAQFSLLTGRKLTSEEREQFLNQLSFMTSSGVGTGEALRVIRANYSGRVELFASEVLSLVEAGEGLDSALEVAGRHEFPGAVLALIRAGYQSGEGPEALRAAANFEDDLRGLRKSAGNELFSAFFGYLSAMIATLVAVFYLGPEVLSSSLVASGGEKVSVGWAVVLGNAMGAFMAVSGLFIAFIFLVHYGLRRFQPLVADRITMAIPLWRDIALSKERFLAFFSLKALSSPSISLEAAFELTAKSMPAGMFQYELQEAADAVRRGMPWVAPLRSLSAIDQAALKVVSDRSQLALVFTKLSAQYRERYASTRRLMAASLQMVSALCLSIAGAILFALSILPVLQASSAVLQGS